MKVPAAQPHPVRTGFVTTRDGTRLHYQRTGLTRAPVLLMIHGLGNDLQLWQPQVARWSGSYQTLCYDVFGHGQSSTPSRNAQPMLTLNDLVQHLIDLLDALQISHCAVIGTSMGAVIALAATQQDAQRFSHLVLCGARLHTEASAVADVRGRALKALEQGLEPIANVMLRRWFPADWRADFPQALESMERCFLRTPASGYASCAQALASYDLRGALAQYKQPMLLICGALDEEIPQMMQQYAQLNEQAQFIALSGIGHLPNWQDAQRFNQALATFLEQAHFATKV